MDLLEFGLMKSDQPIIFSEILLQMIFFLKTSEKFDFIKDTFYSFNDSGGVWLLERTALMIDLYYQSLPLTE